MASRAARVQVPKVTFLSGVRGEPFTPQKPHKTTENDAQRRETTINETGRSERV